NSYSGGNTISAGTLRVGSATALGQLGGPLAINSGRLDLNGFSATVGPLSGSAGAVITTNAAAGTATLATSVPAGSSVWAGVIQDNGVGQVALTKTGGGTLVLTAANTYTGTTTIQAGTLELRGGSVGGPVAVAANATLGFNSPVGTSATLVGQLSGAGGLVVNGGGAVRLASVANTLSGTATVNYGSLVVTDAAALNSAAAVVVNYRSTQFNGYTDPGAGGQLVLATGSSMTFSPNLALAGYGPSTKAGGSNNYERMNSALRTVGNVTLTGTITPVSASQPVVIGTDFGTLTISGPIQAAGNSVRFNSASGQNAVNNNYGTLFQMPGTIQVDGQITTGTLNPFTAGTVILTNTANSIGYIDLGNKNNLNNRIGGARLRVANGLVLGGGTLGFNLGYNMGYLEIRTSAADAATSFQNLFWLTGGNGNRAFAFVDHAVGGGDIAQTVVSGSWGGTTGGADNRFDLDGRNGYGMWLTGTGSGSIINNNPAATNNLIINQNSNGLLTLNANFLKYGTGTGNAAGVAFNATGDMVVTGSFYTSGIVGPAIFTKSNNGTLTLTGSVSDYSSVGGGNISLSNGTLEVRRAGILGGGTTNLSNNTTLSYLGQAGTGAGDTVTNQTIRLNGATLAANQAGTAPTALIFSGTILGPTTSGTTMIISGSNTLDNEITVSIGAGTGTNSLTKSGVGTWVLSGNNSYLGTTTLSGGTLKLKDTLTAGVSRDILNNSGTIAFADTSTLQYLGSGSSTEVLGVITPTAGSGRIIVTPTSSGATRLVFSGTGPRSIGATIDFAPATGGTIAFVTGSVP
ncbi:MAG: hypothetical protein EBZ59_10835, partial [Planctomycetia bacterium]|nr:hypothetical protein [Planctomycetia bacterium]